MSYCVYQMWAAPSGLLYPVKPVEGQQNLELAQAEKIARELNEAPALAMHRYQVQSSVTRYSGPRPSKCYDVVRCDKCECGSK
jgi:hypothetical protein